MVSKSKQQYYEKFHPVVSSFNVIEMKNGNKVTESETLDVVIETKQVVQVINEQAMKGSIFDEVFMKNSTKKFNAKNELGIAIDELEMENKITPNPKIEEILARLKEVKKYM